MESSKFDLFMRYGIASARMFFCSFDAIHKYTGNFPSYGIWKKIVEKSNIHPDWTRNVNCPSMTIDNTNDVEIQNVPWIPTEKKQLRTSECTEGKLCEKKSFKSVAEFYFTCYSARQLP